MPCKKSEFVSAINSFAAARVSGDGNLIAFSTNILQQFVDGLEFAEEEAIEESEEETAEE